MYKGPIREPVGIVNTDINVQQCWRPISRGPCGPWTRQTNYAKNTQELHGPRGVDNALEEYVLVGVGYKTLQNAT